MLRSATLGMMLAVALASGGAWGAAPPARGVEAAPAQPRLHGPPDAVASLLATERAFAARSAAAGAEAAFRDYVDPVDGLGFGDGEPLRGAEAVARWHADGGRLLWAPAEVFAATGGDMGTVWGVWSYTPKGADKVLVTGRYVTVWRKDAKGAWKAIIDIGAPDPEAAEPSPKA